ncbi:MAG: hypothetical protein CSA66_02465 [Proteobacteria bacterium]|nr:MAG: hypothetical protein CSA66_02465 [Pseudomonadota bacterium]
MRSTHTVAWLLLTAIAAAPHACAAGDLDAGPSGVEALQRERFALITLVDADSGHPGGDRELVAQAWFVEHEGADRAEVLRLLGVPEGAFVDPAVPTDACVVDTRDLLAGSRGPDDVRLLDAGELLLEWGGAAEMLDSHYIPDVYRGVGGLAYDGVFPGSRAFEAALPLTIRADGSDEVAELAVSVTPPPAVRVHAVIGEPIAEHQAVLPEGALDEPLRVTWGRADPGASDLSVVLLERRGFDRVATVSCVVEDDGEFTIPQAALQRLPLDLGPDQTDRLLVQRLRAVSFTAPGLPDGMAFAIARDWVHLE